MRRASISLFALVLALALASCGGNDSSETTTAESPAANSTQRETGEQSVEGFGSEAGAGEREAILAAEQGYLEALADEDYAATCELLSEQAQASVAQFARQSEGLGCPEILPKILSRSAAPIAREQANGEIAKVRVEGDQAFVIFRAPGAKLYAFTMVREDDEWKATTVSASILVPDPTTLE